MKTCTNTITLPCPAFDGEDVELVYKYTAATSDFWDGQQWVKGDPAEVSNIEPSYLECERADLIQEWIEADYEKIAERIIEQEDERR